MRNAAHGRHWQFIRQDLPVENSVHSPQIRQSKSRRFAERSTRATGFDSVVTETGKVRSVRDDRSLEQSVEALEPVVSPLVV